MAMILGVVGSPRKGKLTDELVSQALEGAKTAGAKTEKVYLVDYEIEPLKFKQDGRTRCPEELNELCEGADAIILGAPVYYGDINGMTKDFMDSVRIENANGKYGLGISIAGGSGKNLCQAIHSIYHWFYDRRIRGIDPTPVCRFNFENALKDLFQSGKKLVKISEEKEPFSEFPNIEDWIKHYESLDLPPSGPLDEILLVTKYLLETSEEGDLEKARQEYETGKSLLDKGKRIESVDHIVKAYKMLYY